LKPKIKQIISLSSIEAASLLLGCYLVRRTPEGIIKVKIVETEAYHQEDPASHSFRGKTPRTWPMFEAGGRLYVYFTYGMHYCINIVVGRKGVGEAVLIRAAEPIEGIDLMYQNRGIREVNNLTNGPGKLAQALGIKDTSLSGKILNKSSIFLEPAENLIKPGDIVKAPRIGIKQAVELPWRFYIQGNPFVSKL
jgi:DNA-3-methyladenine glycosylase